MCLTFLFIVLVLGVATGHTTASCFDSVSDICDAEMPVIPYLTSRDPTVLITNATSNWTFCDVFAINTTTWYKSIYPMSTSCPSMYMCGTKFPIWMNGQNPDTHEGLVNRTSCIKDFDGCCLHTYKLAAVNCGEFMTYCFVDLPSSCHQRYCFDVKKSEPVTDKSHTPTFTQLTKITTIKTTYLSTYANATSQATSASTGLHVSTAGIDTSSISQNTHHTTTVRVNVEETKIEDEKSIIVLLLACLAATATAVLVLVTVIVRHKRMSKVKGKMTIDKTLKDDVKPYETYPVYDDIESIHTDIGRRNEIYNDTLNAGNSYHTIAESDDGTNNTTVKEPYKEEHYYVTAL